MDFLTGLVARARGEANAVQPRIDPMVRPSVFMPAAEPEGHAPVRSVKTDPAESAPVQVVESEPFVPRAIVSAPPEPRQIPLAPTIAPPRQELEHRQLPPREPGSRSVER